jgi:hypothetical protein
VALDSEPFGGEALDSEPFGGETLDREAFEGCMLLDCDPLGGEFLSGVFSVGRELLTGPISITSGFSCNARTFIIFIFISLYIIQVFIFYLLQLFYDI